MTPQPVDATTAAAALTALGYPCTPEQIRQWKHRGKIRPRATTRAGRNLYDPDELLLLARDSPARRFDSMTRRATG